MFENDAGEMRRETNMGHCTRIERLTSPQEDATRSMGTLQHTGFSLHMPEALSPTQRSLAN